MKNGKPVKIVRTSIVGAPSIAVGNIEEGRQQTERLLVEEKSQHGCSCPICGETLTRETFDQHYQFELARLEDPTAMKQRPPQQQEAEKTQMEQEKPPTVDALLSPTTSQTKNTREAAIQARMKVQKHISILKSRQIYTDSDDDGDTHANKNKRSPHSKDHGTNNGKFSPTAGILRGIKNRRLTRRERLCKLFSILQR